MDYDMQKLGAAMRRAREARGWSVRQLGIRTGCVSTNVIYLYEAGENWPGLYNLLKLSEALGIGLEQYLGLG